MVGGFNAFFVPGRFSRERKMFIGEEVISMNSTTTKLLSGLVVGTGLGLLVTPFFLDYSTTAFWNSIIVGGLAILLGGVGMALASFILVAIVIILSFCSFLYLLNNVTYQSRYSRSFSCSSCV